MPDLRFYIDAPLESGQKASLTDQEMHHMLHVMRVKEGQAIELINGRGDLAEALVEKIGKKEVILHIDTLTHSLPATSRLILAQGLPRLARLEYIIEKATELGVSELWLFPAERSEVKELSERQMERLELIIISAMKQCARLYKPAIVMMPELDRWEKPSFTSLFGDVSPSAPSIAKELPMSCSSDLLWAVGPEKGFSEREESYMKKSLCFHGVRLNHNILRTDTAAIAGLSILSAHQL